jgi:hypothetical protein
MQIHLTSTSGVEKLRRPGSWHDGQGHLKTELDINCKNVYICSSLHTKYFVMYQTNDSGLASYVAGQVDRTLSWKVLLLHYYIFLSLIQ